MSKCYRSFALATLLATGGCSGLLDDGAGTGPDLLALSKTEVGVGQSIELLGSGFFTGTQGHTEIRFEGSFRTDGGAQFPVDWTVRPHFASGSRLLLANVGPFEVPFHPQGDEIGVFEGTVTGYNVDPNGNRDPGRPLEVELRVGPSILVRDFQPVDGTCEAPAKRLIGGFPYQITVEAIGFEPVSFTYQVLGEPDIDNRARVFRKEAVDKIATLGTDGELILAPVPADEVFYTTELLIIARNAAGEQISTVYAFGVHQPIEYIAWGEPQIAEIEPPTPVSGCIAGGINGQHVQYGETRSDTRSRQVSYHWDENWVTEHSSQYSTSHESRHGINMSMNRSEERGWTSHWDEGSSWNFEGGGGATFFGLVEARASVARGYTSSRGGSVSGSVSTGYTVGHDYSVADTESWAYTNSESHGITRGSGEFWEVSSTDTISKEVSADIIPSMYGVWYRQATRIVRAGSVVVYNLCGEPQVIADAMFSDYTWAVSLGQDTDCPPLPKPSLPPAQCLIAPCKGG
jgi:hypothetical protein